MAEIKIRNKPDFFRRDWNKKLRIGSKRKKKRKWRAAKGRDNKIRLKEKGYAAKPSIGWRSDKRIRNKINGLVPVRIENLKQLESIKKDQAIIIARIGKKKRNEIIKKAGEKSIKILNKYRNKENATI